MALHSTLLDAAPARWVLRSHFQVYPLAERQAKQFNCCKKMPIFIDLGIGGATKVLGVYGGKRRPVIN